MRAETLTEKPTFPDAISNCQGQVNHKLANRVADWFFSVHGSEHVDSGAAFPSLGAQLAIGCGNLF